MSDRCTERLWCVRLGYCDKSALESHSLGLGHQIIFAEAKVLFKPSSLEQRLVKESAEIQMEKRALNY